MRAVFAAVAVMVAASMATGAPANAEPENIYGLVTPDEQQAIFQDGWRYCVMLDEAADDHPPVTTEDALAVVNALRNEGWDLESAGDITWESVEGRCPEYIDQVKRAMRTFGPMD